METTLADPVPEDEPIIADAKPDVKPKRVRASRSRSRSKSLAGPLKDSIEALALIWGAAEGVRGTHPEPTCGEVLYDQAGPLARALDQVAQTNETVYRWLSGGMDVGGWGAVAIAVLPVAQAFGANHVVPAIARRREAMANAWPADEGEPEPWQPAPETPEPE